MDLTLAVAGVFLAVAIVTGLGTWVVLARLSPTRRRMEALAGPSSVGTVVLEDRRVADRGEQAIARLSRYVPKSPKEMGRLRKRMARAGFHGATPIAIYSVGEMLLPVVVALLVIGSLGSGPVGLLFGALAAIVVYMLPGLVLQRLIVRRQKQIRNGLPDAIDLLIVCIEAGSSMDQAVVKASEELALAYPALAEELRYLNTEIRAGKPRMEAFRNLAERTKVDDVRSLVAMLVQTDRFGTSVAQALRTFAEAARIRRRQDAEERAAKLGVKLLFPLVFCLFPALYVVLLGPAAIKIFRVLIQSVGAR